MGSQQLLFILVGAILVGIAIVVGLEYFEAQARESNRDEVIGSLNTFAGMAQSYYKKDKKLGGGGGTFVGFSLPSELQSTASGNYSVLTTTSNRALMQGVGVEETGGVVGCSQSASYVTYQVSVTPTETKLRKVH